jgi:hypothetical protein
MPRKDLELDLGHLQGSLKKEALKGKIPLKEVAGSARFAAIGPNLFRDVVDNCIWKIQKGEDGLDYIARTETEGLAVESSNEWAANADSSKESVTLSFRGMPLCKFAGKDYGFDKNTIAVFQNYLLNKTQDARFVKSVIALATDKCPNCGGKPVYIGLNDVLCNTPGCLVHQVKAQKSYKTRIDDIHELPIAPKGVEGKGVPFFVGNTYQGSDLNLDKAREYEKQGIVELIQTPQGLIARKK